MERKTVLIIEDDLRIREALQDFLESEGFLARTAPNGQVGLDLIRELKGQCVVLLDLQMPVMTGEELLNELSRELDPAIVSTPIVIITASAVQIERKVAGYLRKPLDLDLLIKTVIQFSS